jgi:hypothetical protein
MKSFRRGIKVKEGPPKRLMSEDIMIQHRALQRATEGHEFEGYGQDHNLTHISFLWEHSYAKVLILPHNIDSMHQVRNVVESIISMCLNIKGKTKDNINARKDLANLCDRPSLEVKLNPNGMERTQRAPYCLSSEEQKEVFRRLKMLKFPDRYAANIKRTVNLDTNKLNGLKAHDYHILMERLMSVMFRGYLKPPL